MDIQSTYDLIADDMQAVNGLIQKRLHSDVVLINQLGHYIINSGGKRLRPVVVLLSARAFDYQGSCHIDIATIIEFIHTATLLHDDVVDSSELRRGQKTANSIWGSEASVLVGDFLYSRAFEMMVDVNSMRVMEILARTTNTIAEGEVMQLLNCHDPDTTEERYLDVIRSKTAKLFEAATQLGAVLSCRPAAEEEAMAAYGMHLGTAFQLTDDVLDYSASSDDLGKNIGDDLAEGKPTLPLIYAMRNGIPSHAEVIRNAIEGGGRDNLAEVIEAIESSGAIAYTAKTARREAEKAIQAIKKIPASPYQEALLNLAKFAVYRTY
ncbi:Trans-hexaprenyltranstransferase [Nitrosococcus halophilus Nc 4]|uniref:Octaprenyl diphosphate synthase n=1 Tax=Nitrosococcus halophilus (strain Nc4) TaxID=472759 RepID=D5C4A9_NITHN|nr:octaprenyl diphosphate synthase [Nitrosococcus halophilus]ADE13297.1 Trans-hexaprenyltranstransferase [Nitrosococcus halophilus Nc 4]